MLNPRRVRRLFVGLLTLASLALPTVARAQQPQPLDRTFSPQLFHPATGIDDFLTIPSADVLPHLNFSIGVWGNYGHGVLSVYNVDQSTMKSTSQRASLISDQLGLDIVAAIGLFERVQIGLGIPMTLYETGSDFTYGMPATTVQAPSGFALGDPWLDVKLHIYGKEEGAQVGAIVSLTVPASLATENMFGGDTSVDVGGGLLAGWNASRWRVGLRVGALYRAQQSRYFSTTQNVGAEVTYGGAIAVDAVPRRLTVLGELYGYTGLQAPSVNDVDANPLEIDIAARLRLTSALKGTVGVGTGVLRGIGAPVVRILAGVTYAPDRRDRDHDGIPDVDDKCVDTPEDKDGFEDEDGCPDPDNDRDTIPDAQDKCPNEAEDFDQFQDEDGCPDPDNDQDGVPDIKDACPNEKEDGKPPHPNDGCPFDKADADGDGIPDYKDKCPDQPEDKDGFQDEDGCPDPDNDGDGYPDAADKCPNEAEDFDGFEDEDGCPDPDNDKDGILDGDDKCPDKPETINGVQDEDGCPDQGPDPKVQIVGKDIVLTDRIVWDKKDEIAVPKTAENMLSQLALTLRAHTELKKVRIEAYTDSHIDHGDHAKLLALSQARAEAVVAYLVKHGVDAKRLEAKGFGEQNPVGDNATARGREANNRIEVKVVE